MKIDKTTFAKEYNFNLETVYIKGHKMSYIHEGKEHPKKMLMLHGNPTWSFYYRSLVDKFKDKYQIIAPDFIGCGLSEKPSDYKYDLRSRIDEISLLAEKIDLTDTLLIMHDWGVTIGIGYAVENVDKFKGFVIMNGASFKSSEIPKRISFLRTPVLGSYMIRKMNLFLRFALPPFSMATSNPKVFTESVKSGYLHPYDSYENRIAIDRFIKDIPMDEYDSSYRLLEKIESSLPNICKHPSLLLWGGDDFCFGKIFFDRWLEILKNVDSCYMEDANHFVLEDKAELVAEKIEKFMSRVW